MCTFPRQLYGDGRVKAKASTDVVKSSSDSSSSSSSSSDAPDDEEDGKLKSGGEQRDARTGRTMLCSSGSGGTPRPS